MLGGLLLVGIIVITVILIIVLIVLKKGGVYCVFGYRHVCLSYLDYLFIQFCMEWNACIYLIGKLDLLFLISHFLNLGVGRWDN